VVAAACRVIPLSREKMTSVITVNHLSAVWTPDRAVQYLLLGGLLTEAVWFVGRLGDWKTQIMLSGIIHYHRENTVDSRTRSAIPSTTFTFSLACGGDMDMPV